MNSEHGELVEAIADALAKLPVRDFHGLELGEHELDILRRREAARAILALPGIESLSLRMREKHEALAELVKRFDMRDWVLSGDDSKALFHARAALNR